MSETSLFLMLPLPTSPETGNTPGLSEPAGSDPESSPPHILHVFPSFGIGGVPLRMARIINHLGQQFRHTIVALDNDFGAAESLNQSADVLLLPPGRPVRAPVFGGLLEAMRTIRHVKPHLLITYNWGAIEWALARRLAALRCHIHMEAGFGKAEADTQLFRRVVIRRWVLATRSTLVVVPSRTLERIARKLWRIPASRVLYIPNGVDIDRFTALPRDIVPGFYRKPGELIIGTVSPLRPEKNIGRLLRTFARLNFPHTRLLIAGDGMERQALQNLAQQLGVIDRVIFAGYLRPEMVLGTLDIFVLSSDTEQMPNSLLEAMAARCAIAAVDVGDVRSIVCDRNHEFIVPRDDPAALQDAITRLLNDAKLRVELGHENFTKVRALFSQDCMFENFSLVLNLSIGYQALGRGGRVTMDLVKTAYASVVTADQSMSGPEGRP